MDLGLAGKCAIVTGASQGIGREVARALHAEGVAVVMVARTRRTLEQAARELAESTASPATLVPIVADLALLGEIERVAQHSVERLGHIDILVNNASGARNGNFFKMTDGELDAAWQVKGLGTVRMVRALAPYMMERRQGEIINIAGSTARTPTADFIVGSMVNAAIANFTRGVSRELAQYDIRINSISPGWTLTERQERSFAMQAAARHVALEEIMRIEARALPLGRFVSMGEVARLTLLLAAGLFPALTGEDILIDGGATGAL